MLIIGGGDGGIARELDRYPSVKEVIMCEIDEVRLSVLIAFDLPCALRCYSLLTEQLCKVRDKIRLDKCKGAVDVLVVLVRFGHLCCPDKTMIVEHE